MGLRIDQGLTQDATGTIVMLELEALGLERVRTGVSVQYVDHNLLQTDERNMAESPVPAFGLPTVRAVVFQARQRGCPTRHTQRFGVPGATLVGSDSHACVAGANYGQGSSREHAAVVPRHLGLRVVITKSYASATPRPTPSTRH